MTFSAPIKVVVRLVVWDKDEETGAAVDPRRQGAGGLLRRNPADDRERHLHHQRHRARRRLPAAPLARRLLRPRQGQEPLVGQAALHRPHHPVPRLVARLRVRPQGHPLRPHRPPPQAAGHGARCARSATRPRSSSTTSTTTETIFLETAQEVREVGRARPAPRPARHARHQDPRSGEIIVKKNRKFTSAAIKKLEDGEDRRRCPSTPDELVGKVSALRRRRREHRRSPPRVQRGAHRGEARRAPQARHQGVQGPLHRQPQRRPVPARHAARSTRSQSPEEAIMEIYRRLRPGDPPTPETAHEPVRQPVLQPRALRPVARSAASS